MYFAILAPAKKQAYRADEGQHLPPRHTPHFLDQTSRLVTSLRAMDVPALEKTMGISHQLATLNHARYQNFDLEALTEDRPGINQAAMLAFKGDVYQSLDAPSLPMAAWEQAQTHLGIISGLYGLLHPLDRVCAYRLDMDTPLPHEGHRNLYALWGRRLLDRIQAHMKAHDLKVLLNLSSQVYRQAALPPDATPDVPVVDLHFQSVRNGQPKTIGILAKRARGAMARWLLLHPPTHLDDVRAFNTLGYRFDEARSTPNAWYFVTDDRP